MKKTKLLAPLLVFGVVSSSIAPIATLTACSKKFVSGPFTLKKAKIDANSKYSASFNFTYKDKSAIYMVSNVKLIDKKGAIVGYKRSATYTKNGKFELLILFEEFEKRIQANLEFDYQLLNTQTSVIKHAIFKNVVANPWVGGNKFEVANGKAYFDEGKCLITVNCISDLDVHTIQNVEIYDGDQPLSLKPIESVNIEGSTTIGFDLNANTWPFEKQVELRYQLGEFVYSYDFILCPSMDVKLEPFFGTTDLACYVDTNSEQAIAKYNLGLADFLDQKSYQLSEVNLILLNEENAWKPCKNLLQVNAALKQGSYKGNIELEFDFDEQDRQKLAEKGQMDAYIYWDYSKGGKYVSSGDAYVRLISAPDGNKVNKYFYFDFTNTSSSLATKRGNILPYYLDKNNQTHYVDINDFSKMYLDTQWYQTGPTQGEIQRSSPYLPNMRLAQDLAFNLDFIKTFESNGIKLENGGAGCYVDNIYIPERTSRLNESDNSTNLFFVTLEYVLYGTYKINNSVSKPIYLKFVLKNVPFGFETDKWSRQHIFIDWQTLESIFDKTNQTSNVERSVIEVTYINSYSQKHEYRISSAGGTEEENKDFNEIKDLFQNNGFGSTTSYYFQNTPINSLPYNAQDALQPEIIKTEWLTDKSLNLYLNVNDQYEIPSDLKIYDQDYRTYFKYSFKDDSGKTYDGISISNAEILGYPVNNETIVNIKFDNPHKEIELEKLNIDISFVLWYIQGNQCGFTIPFYYYSDVK